MESKLDPNDPFLGRRIGPFQLQERLDKGAPTALYLAVRPEGSRKPSVVAMRVALDPADPEAAAAVRAEYDILRAMDDVRIPRAYGYYSGEAALALGYVPGITLADVVQANRDGVAALDVPTALDILVEVAHALRHAHSIVRPEGRIVHGHLGAQRIRLTPDGAVVVVGFGIRPRGLHPAYLAPEQAAGAFVDARSDQWALGALAVELLTGHRLYETDRDPLSAAMEGDTGAAVDGLEQRWPAVGRVIGTLLSPAAGERYEQEQALTRDLMAAARSVPGPADRQALVARVIRLLPKMGGPPSLAPKPKASALSTALVPPAMPEPVPDAPGRPQNGADRPLLLQAEQTPTPEERPQAHGPVDLPPDPGPPDPPPEDHLASGVQGFMPSEIAGFVMGGVLMLVGVVFLLNRLWA